MPLKKFLLQQNYFYRDREGLKRNAVEVVIRKIFSYILQYNRVHYMDIESGPQTPRDDIVPMRSIFRGGKGHP